MLTGKFAHNNKGLSTIFNHKRCYSIQSLITALLLSHSSLLYPLLIYEYEYIWNGGPMRQLGARGRWRWIYRKNYLTLIGWERCILSVTPVQKVYHECKLDIVILDYNWLKDNMSFSRPIISRKMTMKILCRNFEKSCLEWGKKLEERSSGTSPTQFFCVYIIDK